MSCIIKDHLWILTPVRWGSSPLLTVWPLKALRSCFFMNMHQFCVSCTCTCTSVRETRYTFVLLVSCFSAIVPFFSSKFCLFTRKLHTALNTLEFLQIENTHNDRAIFLNSRRNQEKTKAVVGVSFANSWRLQWPIGKFHIMKVNGRLTCSKLFLNRDPDQVTGIGYEHVSCWSTWTERSFLSVAKQEQSVRQCAHWRRMWKLQAKSCCCEEAMTHTVSHLHRIQPAFL